MAVTVHLAFIAWGLGALAVFYLKPPRQALLIVFIAGSLFLPIAGYDVYSLHDKPTIIAVGVLLCSLIFHGKLWLRLRPRWFDLPMFVWCCVSPFASAITNDLGTYDALSAVLNRVLVWGGPYMMGRLYFASIRGVRDLAVGLLIGGVVYIPFCWWEIRMSPQLHRIIYGYYQHGFDEGRFGAFRPTVFMEHGLAVGLWMAATALLGVWLWKAGALRYLRRVPASWIAMALLVTTILCRSLGAIVLLLLGCAVYFLNRSLRTAVPLLCLLAASPLYMIARATGVWSGKTIIYVTAETVNQTRADSFGTRIANEDILVERALQRKTFGWSRWGRSRVSDSSGNDISITDGLWVIIFGQEGLVGLIALWTSVLLPVIVLWRRCPARYWTHRNIAPAVALAVLLVLQMIDNLFNDMGQPVFILATGALLGLSQEAIALALKQKLLSVAQQRSLRPALGARFATARSQRP